MAVVGLLAAAGGAASQTLIAGPESTKQDAAPARSVHQLSSGVLGETRRLEVDLPASFAKTQRPRSYPVIVVLDGESLLDPVVTAARELARHGQIPDAVIVGIHNNGHRLRDLTPPGMSVSGSSRTEGGHRFLEFIESEVLPAVRSQFRTTAAATLVGHSSGGLLATFAPTRPANAFRTIVALDAPVQVDGQRLSRLLIEHAAGANGALRYSSVGAQYGWLPDTWAQLAAAAPGLWRVTQHSLTRESHTSMPLLGAYLGLRDVFADYSRLAAPSFPSTRILPYYEGLTAIYGAPVEPPEVLVRDVIEDFLLEGRGHDARQAFDRLVTAYGAGPQDDETNARVTEAERTPAPAETVDALLATPFPSASEAAPFLGRWAGRTFRNGVEAGTFLVELTAKGQTVTGQLTRHVPASEPLIQPLQFLRIGPDGFTYGVLNGMRPRGMLLYETVIDAGVARGRMRWGGITNPEGAAAPTISVELRRVEQR